ncbi:MAG: glycerol-3-phosphate acyltransferase [Candidatus Moduliflexus flocculans]|nr:glycerol-3-phosphate acyltransferase [Candidatus Moduliflexus flocculans]
MLVRWTGRKDVRDFGSRSTGATNVLRVGGWKSALPVAVFDILKGFLPVFLALRLFDEPRLAAVCGFAAVVGHCYPFAIGFRGGKGVATRVGAFAAIAWLPCLACLGLFLVVVGTTRYRLARLDPGRPGLPGGVPGRGRTRGRRGRRLAIAALIVFRHRANIGRLVKGTGRKLGEKSA